MVPAPTQMNKEIVGEKYEAWFMFFLSNFLSYWWSSSHWHDHKRVSVKAMKVIGLEYLNELHI